MKYAALAITAILLLTACAQTPNTPDLSDPFIGGTKGLAMSFENGAPPREIYDADQFPFSVYIRIQNLGESAVGPDSFELSSHNDRNNFGLVQIIGINPSQFGYPEVEKTFEGEAFSLDGAKRGYDGSIIAGGTDVIGFEDFSYLPDEHGNSQVTLRANICYDYSTHSNTRVCIKDQILENVQDSSICVLAGAKDVKNSGAPVHVTSVTQNPLGRDKIQVTFTIENVGTGRIFKRSEAQSFGLGEDPCDTSPTNPNRDYVHVKVTLNDASMTGFIQCQQLQKSNEGFIPLRQGAPATVTCTIAVDPAGNRVYTDTLHVDLEYTYMEYIETPILIRDVSTASSQ